MTSRDPDSGKGISVWIVDDHYDFRETLKELITSQEDMECTAAFASCERMLDELPHHPDPDLVLMDINFRDRMSGIEGIQKFHHEKPDVYTLLLTMHIDEELILAGLRNGAFGYHFKLGPPEPILEGIRELVYRGITTISAPMAGRILELFNRADNTRTRPILSHRETHILSALNEGHSLSKISSDFTVTTNTVYTHIIAIYKKLHQLPPAPSISG